MLPLSADSKAWLTHRNQKEQKKRWNWLNSKGESGDYGLVEKELQSWPTRSTANAPEEEDELLENESWVSIVKDEDKQEQKEEDDRLSKTLKLSMSHAIAAKEKFHVPVNALLHTLQFAMMRGDDYDNDNSPEENKSGEIDRFISEEFEMGMQSPSDSSDASSEISLRDSLVNRANFKDEDKFDHHVLDSKFASPAEIAHKTAWGRVSIPSSRDVAISQLKDLIRKGVPESKRGNTWAACSGAVQFKQRTPKFFERNSRRVFGTRQPKKFYEVPTFGGQVCAQDHYLTQDGYIVVSRILWRLAMENPDIDFAPSIPDFLCMLLLYQSEEDAFLTCSVMLAHSRMNPRWYFSLSNKQVHLFLFTFRSLLDKHCSKLSAHMDKLGVTVAHFASTWFRRLFVGSLPYASVLRVIDSFISEGSKVLYRVGLAIAKTSTALLLGTKNKNDFVNTLEALSLQFEDQDLLMRRAFGISRMSRKHTDDMDLKNKALVADVKEPEFKAYYIPKIKVASDLITDVEFGALWSLLPNRFKIKDPEFVYSTEKHGFNLSTLLRLCEGVAPAFLLIKTKDRVFGGFASQGFRQLKFGERYYGDKDCFLFRIRPDPPKKYFWRAGNGNHFMRVEETKGISFGSGGKGLFLNEELWKGRSEYCETYENEKLHGGDDIDFQAMAVEIYGLG
eukprot:TRINITY_DN7858_c0_g1_i2.p1 TRINITY_DN7858_c0_g1~~TRINITY_DN7858_c0_g1_i2.p1  ORF type:complete len:675 (+),score=120.67 TRINITY_DN7858_c0_g1_i2:213-2237(+)